MLAELSSVLALAAAAPTLPPLESIPKRCGSDFAGVRASTFWFRAADGSRLDGALLGRGAVGVVLATEYPSDLCRWVPYALVLRNAGYRVLLFDFRGLGLSPRGRSSDFASDVVGAARELRRRGEAQVFLVGASVGGAASIVAGTRVPWVSGVVSLSGETDFSGTPLHPLRVAPLLRVPLLVMGSRQDRYLTVAQAHALIRAAGSRDKRLVLYPGASHGWDLLYEQPTKKDASAKLLGFLRAYS